MKISVCGKGGSGKSTVVALLANEALARGYQVLVVDSDESNSGLFRMLGFEEPPVPLMELVGGKQTLKQNMGQTNILSEKEIAISNIPEHYLLRQGRLQLIAIGKILQSLEGCACPMGVLNREFLKKLRLETDELVIVDMEAGVEHFGRGVDTSIDGIVVVVEPPLESVNTAQKIYELASGIGIRNVWAIMNKIPSRPIAKNLKTRLEELQIEVIGYISFGADIFRSSLEGKIPTNGLAIRETKDIMEGIISRAGIPVPSLM